MSEPTGELIGESDPEPPPNDEELDYGVMLQAELQKLPPDISDTNIRLGRQALIHLYTIYDEGSTEQSYGVKVIMTDVISAAYQRLDSGVRQNLEYEVIKTMAKTAEWCDPSGDYAYYYDRTQAIMNHRPLLFEPFADAMLVGSWQGRDQQQLVLEGEDIATWEQRRILLGGLARFMTFVDQQNR